MPFCPRAMRTLSRPSRSRSAEHAQTADLECAANASNESPSNRLSHTGVAGAGVAAAFTVTEKSKCALLPTASVAVQLTGVTPTANTLPDDGEQATGSAPS